MSFFYTFLDLPDPPTSVIDQAYKAYDEQKRIGFCETNLHDLPGHKEYRNRSVKYKDGNSVNSVESIRFWISKEYDDWIIENVQPEVKGCGVNIFERGPLVAPHVDANRNYQIQYLLETGGDSVETAWYQEKGKEVLRPDIRHVFDLDKLVLDYNDLVELDRVVFPKHKWVCINTNIIHAVENIESRRMSLQISRQSEPDHINYTYVSKL
jgi:hypothetical protein